MKKLSLFGAVGVLIAAGVFAVNATVLAAPVPIMSDGFESAGNLTDWTATGNWQEGGNHPHSGSREAQVHGPTGILNDRLVRAISTVGYVNISFSYSYRITNNLESSDHVKAQYSTDSGANWTTVANYTNEAAGQWQDASFTLPASAANNPNFKVRFTADLNSGNDEFRLDDIVVSGDPIVYTTTTTVVQTGDLDNTSSSPAVVRADGLNKWFEYNDTTDTIDNTLGTFVSGPSTAPLGTGSIQFSLAASNSRNNIATYQFGGTPLSGITALSYSAYSHSGVAGATESPYLQFNIDFTGSHTWQKRLVYLPSDNGAVPQDQWNTFDTINSGTAMWRYSGANWPAGVTSNGSISGTTPRSWSDILADYPNASVLSTDSWLGVRVGEPGPTGYTGNIDNITVGVLSGTNLTTKTFDFEPYTAPACDGSTTFDTFTAGSVSGQGGWMGSGIPVNPSYDQAIVDNTYNIPSFGCKTLRLSDAVTSGSFGDWIFTPSVANEAGESAASNAGFSSGTRTNHFVAQFDFASAQALGLQSGQHVSISPDRGDGARMSYVRLEDQADGIHVYFDDVTDAGPVGTVANFNETDIATLDRTTAHTIKFDMTFVDGPSNDIVKVYVDGTLKITGTSWEDYYRYDPEQTGSGNQVPTVDSLIIQARGSADPANAGKGFLFDNFNLSTDSIPGSIHITKYECPAGTTVNRTDNGVGGSVPSGCVPQQGAHFGYVAGSQYDAGSPYPEFSAPVTAGGTTDANGELTVDNLSATGRYAVFELDSNDQKIADSALFGMYCTGDADPTPTHNDNGDLTFVPAGGTTQCVAYDPDTTAPPLPTHLSPADNSTVTTAALDHIDWTDVTDTVSNPVTYLYEVSNSSDTNPDGSFVSPVYQSGTLTDSQIATAGTPEGQYYWHVRAVDAAGNMSAWTAPWHVTVDNTPPTYQVHIVKYIDGAHATADIANFMAFSMQATYSGTSQELGVINGSNPYDLDAAGNYEATTLHLSAGFHYGTSENMTDAVGASCSDGKPFALAGYTTGATLNDALAAAPTTTAPDFTDIESDEYVVVWNVSCAPAPVATVTTNAATNITASDAQLNGHNGGSDAQGHSFWISTASFDTSSPSIPANVYSTPDMGAVAANTDFNANLSVVTTSGVPSNMPAIQPNTTYYVTAWVNVGGTWYPGSQLSFTTGDGSPTPTPGVTTNDATGVSQTDATLNATVGAVDADAESFWVSTSSYDTSTSNIPAGVYSTPVLSGVAANGTFSDALSLVTTSGITTGGVPGNMPAITAGTTYYYNAWAHVNGTWYPGAIKTVTTDSVPPPPKDTTTPVLTLIGGNPLHIKVGSTYVDPGVTISDTPTDNLGYTIATDGAATTSSNTFSLDTSTEGTHVLTYSATDGGGNTGTVTRTVMVDGTSPTVVLSSDSSDPTTDNPIHVTATFSEEVTGFDQTDIAASSASISNFQASSTDPLVYTFDVIPTGSSITVSVAEHKYTDLAGNENQSQADFSRTIGSNTPQNTAPTGSGSNGGGGGGNGSPSIFGLTVGGGLVLGTSTVNDTNQSSGSCNPLITTFMGLGRTNDAGQVKALQTFLNGEMSSKLPVSGFFGLMTDQVVKQFQVKYKNDILSPWGLTDPTGYVYTYTQKKINEIHCAQ